MHLLTHPIALAGVLILFAIVLGVARTIGGASTLRAIGYATAVAVGAATVLLVTEATLGLIARYQVSAGSLLFFGLAVLVITSAGGVALSSNILYSGFFLMGTLAGVAGLYLYIGADFVGIVQLLIYVGGILVLLLFAVLLTNRISAVNVSNASVHRGVAAAAATGLFVLIVVAAVTTRWPQTEAIAAPTTARLGDGLLREYVLPFELISLILLMALVGAMVIARHAAKDAGASADVAPGLERLK
jgi:NAD(P)H-quinone oxidoreductase subunit 6